MARHVPGAAAAGTGLAQNGALPDCPPLSDDRVYQVKAMTRAKRAGIEGYNRRSTGCRSEAGTTRTAVLKGLTPGPTGIRSVGWNA